VDKVDAVIKDSTSQEKGRPGRIAVIGLKKGGQKRQKAEEKRTFQNNANLDSLLRRPELEKEKAKEDLEISIQKNRRKR